MEQGALVPATRRTKLRTPQPISPLPGCWRDLTYAVQVLPAGLYQLGQIVVRLRILGGGFRKMAFRTTAVARGPARGGCQFARAAGALAILKPASDHARQTG
jgi:hypothetical protein